MPVSRDAWLEVTWGRVYILEPLTCPGEYSKCRRSFKSSRVGEIAHVLEYEDGLRAVSIDNCFTWDDHGIEWRVEGTEGIAKGTIGWPDYPEGSPSTLDFTTTRRPGYWFQPRWGERWFPQAFVGTMGQLMKALEESVEPELTGRDNLKTMALVEAAYLSVAEGRAVGLEEIEVEEVRP